VRDQPTGSGKDADFFCCGLEETKTRTEQYWVHLNSTWANVLSSQQHSVNMHSFSLLCFSSFLVAKPCSAFYDDVQMLFFLWENKAMSLCALISTMFQVMVTVQNGVCGPTTPHRNVLKQLVSDGITPPGVAYVTRVLESFLMCVAGAVVDIKGSIQSLLDGSVMLAAAQVSSVRQ
jgi:hypothetical protein